jgi:hypothetical protein
MTTGIPSNKNKQDVAKLPEHVSDKLGKAAW